VKNLLQTFDDMKERGGSREDINKL